MKRTYEVWATVWSETEKKQVKRLQGTFDTFLCARIFREAYNAKFCAHSEIVEIHHININEQLEDTEYPTYNTTGEKIQILKEDKQ